MARKNEILPLTRTQKGILPRIKGEPDRRQRHRVPSGIQAQRLGQSIEESFSNIIDRDDIEVADDPSSLAPERALVLEIIGSPERFVNAASKVGLEWLAEEVAILRGVRSYFDPQSGTLDDEDDAFSTQMRLKKTSNIFPC